MPKLVKNTVSTNLFAVVLLYVGCSAKTSDLLKVKCGEVEMTITVNRLFFEERNVPFKPEYLRLGANSSKLNFCGPEAQMSESEMVITAGLQECGAQSSVHGDWLVFTNQLVLFPALVSTNIGGLLVRVVIPFECHYKRKWTVSGEPLTPTWQPMTSTISAFGLLHFSLRTMKDGCSSIHSSSVYQQGETLFLEASIEAPLHPPLTLYVDYCVATLKPDPLSMPSYKFISKHGCLMDSMLPGSSSKFFPRKQDNRICFSVHAFQFNKESVNQMFISCHLRATLKQIPRSYRDKACFFQKPTFRWSSTEGDNALCECCDSDDCFSHSEEIHTTAGDRPKADAERRQEADATVGPIHILSRSHWTGSLLVNHQGTHHQPNK
ncbi:zona pellucida sperm-binding protein 3-like [Cheilinus undulatus]|uniref:zona pellucida sperm-binding protein 3-like n=1 Tax=Cheilinus undulatus TaxID=241271 RepID=UPI001BD1FC18|nr:zona pellucida sperm-binding protein 3-like [Cheilinus undulatus]XP_041634751.1 zona pellucida sperm-binding protein 3-like [Cheilinus undulatus]XP_041634752.1 zona pellucida sperm-binding protein 3-like [Cheilinus undulatus]